MPGGASAMFRWNLKKRRAAAALADGRRPAADIAAEAGVSDRMLRKWATHPDFAAHVAAIRADAGAAIAGRAIADKAGRLTVLAALHDRLLEVFAARAAAATGKAGSDTTPAAGEATGLVAVKETIVGRNLVREAAIDTAALRELRAIQEQAARELGQWEATVAVKHSGVVRHAHTHALSRLSDAELDQLAALAAKIEAGEVGP